MKSTETRGSTSSLSPATRYAPCRRRVRKDTCYTILIQSRKGDLESIPHILSSSWSSRIKLDGARPQVALRFLRGVCRFGIGLVHPTSGGRCDPVHGLSVETYLLPCIVLELGPNTIQLVVLRSS
jgi:hypothetical protein